MAKVLRWAGAACVGVTLLASTAQAQIEAGDKSVAINGMYATLTGVEDATFSMGIGYLAFNKFQTSKFAWRFSTLVQVSDAGDGAETSTGFGGGLEWNFNKQGQTTIPFVAMDAFMFTASGDSYTMVSPSAGFRAFVSRSTSFDVAASYNTIVSGPEEASGGLIMLRMGFSYYLGKDPRR
jgi:hypothetical protein